MNDMPETVVPTHRSSSVGWEMPTPDTPQVLLEHLKALRLPTILILAFWFGPAVVVNFGPPERWLGTLRGWGNGSVAG